MKNQSKFFNLIWNGMLALFFGVLAFTFMGAPVIPAAAGTYVALSAGKTVVLTVEKIAKQELQRNHALFMAVQTEVWENFVAENLYQEYSWVKRAKDRSSFVLEDKVVHIPQAGAKPQTSKNRENYPIPVVKRNDSDITYPIDELSTDSTYIPDAEKIELSYDKIADVFGDHTNELGKVSAQDILDRWYPSLLTKMVRTTGGAVATHLVGSTGNRKKFTVADVAAAKTKLNNDTKRTKGNRGLIMSEDMYNQLKSDTSATNLETQNSVGAVWDKDSGDLVKIHGFDIIRTDVTGRFSNAGTPVKQDYTTALVGAATDNDVVLAVDFTKVHFALGSIKFFEGKDDVHYQGDIYNAKVRFGGRKERADEIGVIAIIQEP